MSPLAGATEKSQSPGDKGAVWARAAGGGQVRSACAAGRAFRLEDEDVPEEDEDVPEMMVRTVAQHCRSARCRRLHT